MQKTLSIICWASLTLSLTLTTACGGSSSNSNSREQPAPDPASPTIPADGIYRPALADSPYARDLVTCITIETLEQSCRLSRLPYIGQETTAPTKADIMARTVISHPWMAERFSQLLDEMPAEIYQLFRGVTGIVIGADIRPSYYWAVSGAIYLDPADLWVTDSERRTISQAPDFRSEFARELAFSSLSRYVQGDNYAWDYYPLDGEVSHRPLALVVKPMAALLFHELAHANDFIPPALVAHSNSHNTPLEQVIVFEADNVSLDLKARAPLSSQLLYDLAAVMYHGAKANTMQKSLSATTVGLNFQVDGANDPYAYASLFEDTAMLFEEVMMKYHFNIDRDVAFTDAPVTAEAYCDDYVVRWGQRNRIGDPLVKSRAEIVVQQLLDRRDSTAYFAQIPAPRAMRIGHDWCENINFNPAGLSSQKASSAPADTPGELLPPAPKGERKKIRPTDFGRPVLQ